MKTSNILSTLALSLGLVGAAQAAPISFQDVVNPSDVLLSASGQKSYTFQHNILDNGFQPSGHTLSSVKLNLSLADDNDLDFFWILPIAPEYGSVSADGSTLLGLYEVNTGSYLLDVNTALLQADGKLKVTVTAHAGDFYFKSSTLDATAEVVPEPSTVALLGLGLVGIGFAARRRKAA